MKKLINTCRAIQTVSAVVAAVVIILMATAYEPSIKTFLIMGVIFLIAIAIAAVMALVLDIAKEMEFKRQEESEPTEDEDDDLPPVEEKEVTQERSCRSFYDCRYNNKGFYVNERRISIASKDNRRI